MSKQHTGQAGSDRQVHSITDARAPHTDEIRTRMIKYSISMGIRVICLVLVFVVDGWLQWVFIAGAVLLPYFAVIIANGGSDTSKMQASDALLDRAPARQLESGAAPRRPDGGADQVLHGEIISDEDEAGRKPHTP